MEIKRDIKKVIPSSDTKYTSKSERIQKALMKQGFNLSHGKGKRKK